MSTGRHIKYLTRIFSSHSGPRADHVCCDVSAEGVTAVALGGGDDGEFDRTQGERVQTSAVAGGAPSRHPAHPARQQPCVLFGEWGERHVPVQLYRCTKLKEPTSRDRYTDQSWYKSTAYTIKLLYHITKHNKGDQLGNNVNTELFSIH